MGWLSKRKSQLARQVGGAALTDAMAVVQQPAGPPRIHNPYGGTRSHYRDPDYRPGPGQEPVRPVCKASGTGWAEGDGGLRECGLCPYMWAQRQLGSDGEVA